MKAKPAPRRAAPRRRAPEEPATPNFVEVAKLVRWVAAFVGAVFAAIIGYWTFADRVDNHWLTTEKAHQHFVEDERTSAWLLYGVTDLKASAARQWLRSCRRDKLADCSDEELQANQAASEAADLKKQAAALGRAVGKGDK